MSEDAAQPRWALIALLAAVVLVVVVGLIAVLARGGPTAFAADSPEGVVQRYSQAIVDGDEEAALAYVSADIRESCERVSNTTDDSRVTLVKTSAEGDHARVKVLVTTLSGSGPLGGNEYQSEEEFQLVKIGGNWLIERAPWQFAACYEMQ